MEEDRTKCCDADWYTSIVIENGYWAHTRTGRETIFTNGNSKLEINAKDQNG